MRISDWSSDVCSSDPPATSWPASSPPQITLAPTTAPLPQAGEVAPKARVRALSPQLETHPPRQATPQRSPPTTSTIGRASCRERVCQYVLISLVAESLTKKQSHTLHNHLSNHRR